MDALTLDSSANAYGEPIEGFLEIEEDNANAFRKRYFVLNRITNVLEYYRERPRIKDLNKQAHTMGEIEIKYLTNVSVSTQRQNKKHCFEICTIARKFYLAAASNGEMQRWISALHHAAVNPRKSNRSNSDCKVNVRSGSDSSEKVSYQTKIVGGVVIKCPVKKQESDSDSLTSTAERTPGVRLVKDGWCFKQGAVMRNWKRRYFTLNVFKLCYFEKAEDSLPLKTILIRDVRGVRPALGYSDRDNVFEVDTPYRKFYVQADTHDDMQAWIKEIKGVISPVLAK